MPRLKSPSLKQLGLVPYSFPERVEEHPFTQQAQWEGINDPSVLAEVWRVTRNAIRTDKLDEKPFEGSFAFGQKGRKRGAESYLTKDVPIISAEIKKYVARQVKFSLYKFLQADPRLSKYLFYSGFGRTISGPITVDVTAGDQLQIKVTGPYWLQFYFYGARAHTVYGKNPTARYMLVFYNSSGDKVVTPSVNIKSIQPGLYIEKAIQEVLANLAGVVDNEVEKELELPENLTDDYEDQIASAQAYLEQQQQANIRAEKLHGDRQFALGIQRELEQAGRELSRLQSEMRRRRVHEPLMSDDPDYEKPEKEPKYFYNDDGVKSKNPFWRKPKPRKFPGRNIKRQLVREYNNALELYLNNYVMHMQLSGASDSNIRDVVMPERVHKGSTQKRLRQATRQLKDLGIKVHRRSKSI